MESATWVGEDTENEVMECIDRGKVSWGGLRVAGLCIGVDEYTHISPLGNAVRDAEEVNKALKKVPGCYSTVLRNPTTRAGLMKSIKKHLQEDALLDKSPQFFFFYYAGHGIEHKRRVYLVPADAIMDDEDDLVSCVPLDEVMQMFVKELDTPVLKKLGVAGAITFIVVLDSCRVSLAISRSVDVDLEPEKPSSAPHKYTIIFSCSRTMPASDGQRGGHSPFAKAVLDADHGFFSEGIALNAAISKVSSTLKSMTKDQRMLIHGTADAIPEDFCIQPKAVFGPPHVLEVGMASEGGARGCDELTLFLKDNGFLPDVAARISENMQVSVKHFLELKRGDIDMDDIELSFLKRQHKKLLLALIDSTADSISSRDSADSDSDASTQAAGDMSEASDSEDDLSHSVVAGYHVGNMDEILARLKMFFHGLMDENPLRKTNGNLSLCTILWISFLRKARYQPSQVGTFGRRIDRLVDGMLSEDDTAKQVDSFVRDLISHKLLDSIKGKIVSFPSRLCVASVAIIDHMVAELLVADDVGLAKWNEEVVGSWYGSQHQTLNAFLARANDFLRDSIGSVRLLACVQTQSCVAFLRMPKVAAHIFFEYLHVGKQKELSRTAGARQCSSSLWHGFQLFVSNTHRMSSLTRQHEPSQIALPIVRQGLECLAHLPAHIWDILGPVETIRDLLLVQTGPSRSRASDRGRIF